MKDYLNRGFFALFLSWHRFLPCCFRLFLTSVFLYFSVYIAHASDPASLLLGTTKVQQDIYFLYWNLEFDKAEPLLVQDIRTHTLRPEHLRLKSTGLTLQLLLKGDKYSYFRYKGIEDKWIDSLKKMPEDASNLYTRAMIKLHWAVLKTAYGEGLSGAWSMRSSYLQLKEIHQKWPQYLELYPYLGALEVALSRVPESYQWATELAGLEGNEKRGIDLLKNSQKGSPISTFEADFLSLLLKHYMEVPREELLPVCERLHVQYPYKVVQLVAVWLYNKNNASERANLLWPNLEKGTSYPYFHYLKGITLLQTLHLKEAQLQLEQYVTLSKSANYKKDALYRLSILYGLQGDSMKAARYKERVKKLGNAVYYADKQAQKWALIKHGPSYKLILAKWAFDGGAFASSLDVVNEMPRGKEELDKVYLRARNYDLLGERKESIEYYKKTIVLCPKEGVYLGPMSYLHLATLEKEKGNVALMNAYLESIKQFKNYDHKKSIQEKGEKLKAGVLVK